MLQFLASAGVLYEHVPSIMYDHLVNAVYWIFFQGTVAFERTVVLFLTMQELLVPYGITCASLVSSRRQPYGQSVVHLGMFPECMSTQGWEVGLYYCAKNKFSFSVDPEKASVHGVV